jgi:hypothetical protein
VCSITVTNREEGHAEEMFRTGGIVKIVAFLVDAVKGDFIVRHLSRSFLTHLLVAEARWKTGRACQIPSLKAYHGCM